MYPDARIGISYGVPTYWAKSGRVGLAYWSGGVSFYPFGGDYLDEFRAEHPAIKTSKGTINFKVSEKVPVAALKKIIRQSIEQSPSSREDWQSEVELKPVISARQEAKLPHLLAKGDAP